MATRSLSSARAGLVSADSSNHATRPRGRRTGLALIMLAPSCRPLSQELTRPPHQRPFRLRRLSVDGPIAALIRVKLRAFLDRRWGIEGKIAIARRPARP